MHGQTCLITINIYAAKAHSSLGLKVILISGAKMRERWFHPCFASINFSAKKGKENIKRIPYVTNNEYLSLHLEGRLRQSADAHPGW